MAGELFQTANTFANRGNAERTYTDNATTGGGGAGAGVAGDALTNNNQSGQPAKLGKPAADYPTTNYNDLRQPEPAADPYADMRRQAARYNKTFERGYGGNIPPIDQRQFMKQYQAIPEEVRGQIQIPQQWMPQPQVQPMQVQPRTIGMRGEY